MLYDGILSQANKIRFHTPGHGELPTDLLRVDVTELPYSDNLANPTGEIRSLEKNLASAFRAEAAFLSTQGATHNIFQAIYATRDSGAFLVVGKTHLSVYNALRLFCCKAYHVDVLPPFSEFPPDVKTVVLTEPDYFGKTNGAEKVCALLRKNGYCSIVDAAHGAHFAFSSKLPVSASEYADLAILSLHKTLPVLTGGSVLCCKKAFAERASYCRKLLHTTSPNYMTMASVEIAVNRFTTEGEEIYSAIERAVEEFRSTLRSPFVVEPAEDFSRVVVSSPYDGKSLYGALYERGFVPEMSYENKVVFIVTYANYFFLPTLSRILGDLPSLPAFHTQDLPFCRHEKPTLLSFGQRWETATLTDAVGRRAFSEVGLYPPGAPLLYAGDEITDEIARYLTENADRTFGLENGRVRVIQ